MQKNMSDELEFISPEELARYLKVSRPMPYLWIKKGLLPYVRIGKIIRFRKSDVLEFIEHRLLINNQ